MPVNYQTQSNAYIAYKLQSARGVQASGSGAKILRTAGGQAGRLTMAAVESSEVRRDGMRTRGRHGTRKSNGAYTSELSLQQTDDLFQAIMRGTWGTPNLTITQADITSITTGSNTIVGASGDFTALGLRVGDVIVLTNHTSPGNNSRNLRVAGLTANTITTAETDLTVNATPDTTITITRPGRVLINPPTGSLIERYFTIEEQDLDIDGAEVFTDCKFGMMKFAMQPDGLIMLDTSWVGTGQFNGIQDSNSPWFTTPTETTAVPMAVADATVRINGTDQIALSSFDVTMDLGLNGPSVFGSAAQPYSPDVFAGQMAVSINFTALRKDLQRILDYNNEAVYSLHVFSKEFEAAPEDFISIYVGNFSLGDVQKSALSRDGGPRTEQVQVPAALVGKDNTGAAYDASMCKIQVSNAS